MARSLAVPERAHRLRRLVVEAREHLVQLERSKGEHEPFAGRVSIRWSRALWRGTLHVGSGKAVHGLETETCVFDEHGTADLSNVSRRLMNTIELE